MLRVLRTVLRGIAGLLGVLFGGGIGAIRSGWGVDRFEGVTARTKEDEMTV
jgi:hypothetical protein